MRRQSRHDGFPEYVPVAERRMRAEKALTRLKITFPEARPVIVTGRKLAVTWWGEAWNRNLERYADYANRIERGRSYLRHGAVLDLSLTAGNIRAMVQGSDRDPYRVSARIDPLAEEAWQSMIASCQGRLTSLEDLITGQFPKSLSQVFMESGRLFPTPDEIHVKCNCPDIARLCKHISAVLYGVGTRLDEDPRLFFTLRQVKIEDLIGHAVIDETDRLLKRAQNTSPRAMTDSKEADLSELFGIDLDDTPQ